MRKLWREKCAILGNITTNAQNRSGFMLKDERKAELLQMIEESGYISVEELSSKLYISQSTIRRNLTQLEKLGYVKRTHGGVEMCDESYHAPVRLRMKKNHMAKSNVAKLAAERIRDDSIIFLDCSSTCLHMVPYLQKKKNITVYTNGVEMCSLLAETEIPVYCLGGCLIPKSRAFSGEMSIAMAKTMFFDAMFFSCAGWIKGSPQTICSRKPACGVCCWNSPERNTCCATAVSSVNPTRISFVRKRI